MEIKKKQLYELADGLHKVKQKGSKFCYVISKNKREVDIIITELEKKLALSDRYKEFLEKLEAIRRKHAEKDENGNPKIGKRIDDNGVTKYYYIGLDPNDKESDFMKEITSLEKEYDKDIKEKIAKENWYYNEFLKESINVDLYMIKLSDVPKDISQEEMDGIFLIINDDEQNN